MPRNSVTQTATPERANSAKANVVKTSLAPEIKMATVKKVSSKTTRASNAATSDAPVKVKQTRQRIRPETRAQMLERLMNPEVSLHEASVILGVCRATVRRYADMGTLVHERTEGRQRRFHLRDVLALSRTREAEKRKRR